MAEHILVYEAPDKLPSINDTAGRHWGHTNSTKQAWQEAAHYYAVDHFGPVGPSGRHLDGRWLIKMGLPFAHRRRRDPHNYIGTVVKWTIDGLVQAGVWPDDTAEYVKVTDPVLLVGSTLVAVRLVALTPDSTETTQST